MHRKALAVFCILLLSLSKAHASEGADLVFEKRSAFHNAQLLPGSNLHLAFAVYNKPYASSAKTEAFAYINIPKNISLVEGKNKACTLNDDEILVCDLKQIASGERAYQKLDFKIDEIAANCGQEFNFLINLSSSKYDPDRTNNHSEVFKASTLCADSKLTVASSDDEISKGETFTYSIGVDNLSNSKSNYSAFSVVAQTELPPGIKMIASSINRNSLEPYCKYSETSSSSVLCNFNKLASGEKGTRNMILRADDTAPCDQALTISTEIKSSSFDPNPENSSEDHQIMVSCGGKAVIVLN